ncbi:MAG: T9SS type A sorting domain-containing protein, partial [Bacteroidota bacterium]|nr:T9SS type A sorting domain-containing protein [Bacteroidota bacterium]
EAGFLIGNASPYFIERNGEVLLLVGGSSGKTTAYALDSDSLFTGSFAIEAEQWGGIDVGAEATPFAYDINNDGFMDILYGNRRGGLSLYSTTVTDSSQILSLLNSKFEGDFTLYPNPAYSHLTLSGISSKNAEIKILDFQGRTLHRLSGFFSGEEVSVDISFLERGTYLVVLSGGSSDKLTRLFTKH